MSRKMRVSSAITVDIDGKNLSESPSLSLRPDDGDDGLHLSSFLSIFLHSFSMSHIFF